MALNLEMGINPNLAEISTSGFPKNKPGESTTDVLQSDLTALEEWKIQTLELERTDIHAILFLKAAREALKKKE